MKNLYFLIPSIVIAALIMIGVSIERNAKPQPAVVATPQPVKPPPIVEVIPIPPDPRIAKLEAFITLFLEPVKAHPKYRERLANTLALIPVILKYADAYGVCPILVAVTAGDESSFQSRVIGARGEVGILQVMPGRGYKRENMETVEQQISAGCQRLAESFHSCPRSAVDAVGHYLTGKCGGVPTKARERVKRWEAAR
jgi:hypothetical protein